MTEGLVRSNMRRSNPLLHKITDRIKTQGPMTFASFMQMALYDPADGYYSHRVPGLRFDYATSPSISAYFGKLIGRLIEYMWELSNRPVPFDVCEVGGGGGELARTVLDQSSGRFADAIAWSLLERAPHVRTVQRELLKNRPVKWKESMPITPPINGCILANEVLDNFPHHILEIRSARLQELHVGLEGDKLVLVPLEISSKAVARAGAHLSDGAPEGHRFEVSLETEPWIDSAAQSIQRGYILLIDYGYVTRELSRTSAGTLVGYSRQRLVDPLQNPGEVDITAHVDFTVVRARLEQAGLDVHEPVSQRELLGSLGMSSHLNRLLAEANAAYGAQSLRLHAERSAAQALVAKGGLGDLKVLIAARNAALPTLAGIKALP